MSVEVVGAQEVFSETEYEQLKTLPAQEQMLVTLASIGLEDVVHAAVGVACPARELLEPSVGSHV